MCFIERVDVGQCGHSRTVRKIHKPQRIAPLKHLRWDTRDVTEARHSAQRVVTLKCGSDKGCSVRWDGCFKQGGVTAEITNSAIYSFDVDTLEGLRCVGGRYSSI